MWKGPSIIQRGVKGMVFTTVLQVPSTKDSILLKELVKIEPRLAKATGYNTKIVEKSGVQLARCFDRIFDPQRCHAEHCIVCEHAKALSAA